MENLLQHSNSPEQFKELGYSLIDLITERLAKSQTFSNPQTLRWESPEEQLAYWQNDFNAPLIDNPLPLFEAIMDKSINLHSRGYLGHQVPPPLPLTVLTAALTAFLNNGMAVYEMGMAGNAMEKVIITDLARRFGLGADASGFVTSGGSLGNLTAMLAARANFLKEHTHQNHHNLSVMVSEEAHYSIMRACMVMGIPTENIVKIPVDNHFSILPDALEPVYQKALLAGKHVFCVIGCACSTATGSYDDLIAMGEFTRKHNIWFHVDGAHGGAAIFSPGYAHLLKGTEKADSIVLDFHKMMMVPSLSTAVIFQSVHKPRLTFTQKADYLWQNQQSEEWYNSGKQTFECTKPMTILHVYTIMRLYGDQLYRAQIDQLYGMAKEFSKLLQQHPDFELACEPQSNIICFRYQDGHSNVDQVNRAISQKLLEDGRFYIVNTLIKGNFYLRISLMNPLVQIGDLKQLLEMIVTIVKHPSFQAL